MKSIPITTFRARVNDSSAIFLHIKNPLSPLDMTMRFDKAFVNTSASPYISLRSDLAQITISHIRDIRQKKEENAGMIYAITCLDYANPHEPTEVTLELECVKIF